MKIFTKSNEIKSFLAEQKNKTIGFVPTMGALHHGHISLTKESQKNCDFTVVSIFVNPTQFAPHEDLDQYPRTVEVDKKLLKANKIDVLFLPTIAEIYPNNIKPEIPPLPDFTKVLEGATRPTHFLGVAQVVKCFFDIIQPTHTFFGQKDYQQCLLIDWLIQKFKLPINLHICPIIREKDGIALSSRNQYLNPDEKKSALILSQTLQKTQKLIEEGETDIKKLENFIQKTIKKFPLNKGDTGSLKTQSKIFFSDKSCMDPRVKHEDDIVQIDYAVIRNKKDLSIQTEINPNSIALLAVKIGKTRLLDNLTLIK